MKTLASITLPLVLLLAACGDEGGKGGEERGTAAGEKITMSPSLYFGLMLSPCTRAAKASLSSTPGHAT